MTNIRLTYDYTLNSIKVVKDSINQLNTKLTLILTISLLLFWLIRPLAKVLSRSLYSNIFEDYQLLINN